MPEFVPDVIAQISYASLSDGFPDTPPILFHTMAEEWHRDSGSSTTGNFRKDRKTLEGSFVYVPQDTTLSTSKNTGIIFTATIGATNFKDDLVDAKTGKFSILQQNETSNTSWELLESTSRTAMTHRRIDLLRGFPAIAAANYDPANTYIYVDFNNGSPNGAYRLTFSWGEKHTLSYSHPSIAGGAWKVVQRSTDIFDHSGGAISIEVQPDVKHGNIAFTINKTSVLHHGADRKSAEQSQGENPYVETPASLPSFERYRIAGNNCFHTVAVGLLRYNSITANPVGKKVNFPVDTTNAKVVANRMSREHDGQSNTHTVTQDPDGKVKVASTASLPDAGEGKGSENPPRFSDILIYIPAKWQFYAGALPINGLRVVNVHEQQMWDDERRYGFTSGTVTSQNYDGAYRNAYGHFSLNIMATNGYRTSQRFRGLMGVGGSGHVTRDWGTGSVVQSAFHDNTWKLQVPLCYELVLDGIALFTAIRVLAEAGSIHPSFLAFIPDTGMPPYGDSFPYPILAQGMGNSPRHRYLPEVSPLEAILDLIRTYGSTSSTGIPGDFKNTPYYLFMDSFGFLHCEPYNSILNPPVKQYSTTVPANYDPNVYGLIEDELTVISDITNMRTEINIQGLDPWNNNLLNYHRLLPGNRDIVGYRSPLLDRDPRYSSDAAMAQAARTHSYISSLPVQYVRFKTAFDPYIFAGQNIIVEDWRTLGRRGVFTIVHLDNYYGLADTSQMRGDLACTSIITARSAESGIVP